MIKKRFTVAVYDENAINGFTVLDLEKPNSSKRLKYEYVYIGSKVSCEIVCNFGNSLAEENEELKQFKEKVFTWIDKEIARNEEAIEWGKETGADSGSIGFYNHMLKRLQNELKSE